MTERETLLAEIAEKQARLAEIDAEPDYEAWRPALEAYFDVACPVESIGDYASTPLDYEDKRCIRGLIAAIAKAPPMGECQPRWPSEAELRVMVANSAVYTYSHKEAALEMARRIRAYQKGEQP
jgi:hypothetical protein